ncbi:MAG: (d)CMP kinase [Clostridium sp.]|nr:(d)CMP kinase [Clostridium sp.]
MNKNAKKVAIAIDGPAGAGKSTISKEIARVLEFLYLDTGAMYRAVALKAHKENIDTLDRDGVSRMIQDIDLKIAYLDNAPKIILDGEDVTSFIKSPEVSIGASNVAVLPTVRLKMVEIQRCIASENNIVMDGRDIGTYVLPNAAFKFFLTASVKERAKRRFKELDLTNRPNLTLDDVEKDIRYRDENDSKREFAPLVKAEDAIEIDATNMTIKQVVEKIMGYVTDHVY